MIGIWTSILFPPQSYHGPRGILKGHAIPSDRISKISCPQDKYDIIKPNDTSINRVYE